MTADLVGCAAQTGMSDLPIVAPQDNEGCVFLLGTRDDRFRRVPFPQQQVTSGSLAYAVSQPAGSHTNW
jgi:hypothetical protein